MVKLSLQNLHFSITATQCSFFFLSFFFPPFLTRVTCKSLRLTLPRNRRWSDECCSYHIRRNSTQLPTTTKPHTARNPPFQPHLLLPWIHLSNTILAITVSWSKTAPIASTLFWHSFAMRVQGKKAEGKSVTERKAVMVKGFWASRLRGRGVESRCAEGLSQ